MTISQHSSRSGPPRKTAPTPTTSGLERGSVRDQKHGQRAEFALHGVEHHAQGFERDGAEQGAVLLFAKNDRSSALTAIQPKQYIADLASDFGAIRQDEGAFGVRSDAEFAKQSRWNNGVHGSRVHQEAEFERLPGFCRVSNVHFDVSQAHKQPRDSSVVSAKKRVKRKAPVRCQRGSPFFLTKERALYFSRPQTQE